ncbi:UNVERIFIED_CONTAM: hypothetical protein Slati_3436500 [Sesamum latifolium]|uniref:Mitochondrial protein n=1 Tax=Sesamum latifolium TaxID=2727402 RepID=A0AAW2UF87_9LAMI
MGHIDKACKLKHKQANEQPQQHVNVVDEQEDVTDKLFMVSNCNTNWSNQMLFVDSGCTSHMSKDERMFFSLNMSAKTKVKLGDGRSVQAEDKSSICVHTKQEPSTFEEAVIHDEWRSSMKEDMRMIEKNKNWSLIPRPRNRHVIGVKWIFQTKLNPDNSVHKYKARLVIKGYSQLAGVDYGDTFASVARHESIRLLLALAPQLTGNVLHLGVKLAFG